MCPQPFFLINLSFHYLVRVCLSFIINVTFNCITSIKLILCSVPIVV